MLARRSILVWSLFFIFICCSLFGAQINEPILISDDNERQQVESTSDIEVFDEDQLLKLPGPNLAKALAQMASISINSNGGSGQLTSVFLRGTESHHTLVLVDGIEINDSSSPARGVDLSLISTEDIQRVEILKGPQAILYGAHALGGVINIITKSGTAKSQTDVSLSQGGDKFYSRYVSFLGSMNHQQLQYRLSLSQSGEEGISAASADLNPGADADGFKNSQASYHLSYSKRKMEIQLSGTYLKNRSELDLFGGAGGDDSDLYSLNKGLYHSVQTQIDWNDHFFLKAYYANQHLNRTNSSVGVYKSGQDQIRLQPHYQVKNFSIIGGVETKSESLQMPQVASLQKYQEHSLSTFILSEYEPRKGWLLVGGGRVDDFKTASQSEWTYKMGISLLVADQIRLKANYGTGLKRASLYQLHNLDNGNQELRAEKARNLEAFIESILTETLNLSVGVYNIHIKNQIEYYSTGLWTGQYRNMSHSEIQGTEFKIKTKLIESVILTTSYVNMLARNKENGSPLPRRPREMINVGIWYGPNNWWSYEFNLNYKGRRKDSMTSPAMLSGRTLYHLSCQYHPNERTSLWIHFENVGNKDYEEIKGYDTKGVTALLGVKLTL